MNTNMLHRQIQYLREQRGITQNQLAETIGISGQAVSKWETGQSCPDIHLLPSLARAFGVSIDTLFGMDWMSSESEKEIVEQYERLRHSNRLEDALTLLEDALFRFPHSHTIMLYLSQTLRAIRPDQSAKAILLCETILHNCRDDHIRYSAIQQLCYLYCANNEYEKAKKIVQTLPKTPICQDLLLEQILTGAELGEQLDTNLEHFMFYIWLKLQKTAKARDLLSDEEIIHAHQTAIQLYEMVYYDGNYGCFHQYLVTNYLGIAKVYARRKDAAHTLKALEKAIYHAQKYRESFEKPVYTNSIFRHDPQTSNTYMSEERRYKSLQTVQEWISTQNLDFLQNVPEYTRLQNELAQYIP